MVFARNRSEETLAKPKVDPFQFEGPTMGQTMTNSAAFNKCDVCGLGGGLSLVSLNKKGTIFVRGT